MNVSAHRRVFTPSLFHQCLPRLGKMRCSVGAVRLPGRQRGDFFILPNKLQLDFEFKIVGSASSIAPGSRWAIIYNSRPM